MGFLSTAFVLWLAWNAWAINNIREITITHSEGRPDELQQDAKEVADNALTEKDLRTGRFRKRPDMPTSFEAEKLIDVCAIIKKKFDAAYGGEWSCVAVEINKRSRKAVISGKMQIQLLIDEDLVIMIYKLVVD